MTETERRTRLYPTGIAYIEGIRAVERLVPHDVGERLLAFAPAAFTTQRPEGQDEPSPDALEDLADIEEHPEFRPPEPVSEAVTAEENPDA